MSPAYIDAADLHFPLRCVGCAAEPAATHSVSARRGYDLLVVAAWEFIDVPVPVCGACKRRRKMLGLLMWIGGPVALLALALVAMIVSINYEQHAIGGVLWGLLFVFAIAMRVRGDALLEWLSLGTRVDYLRGKGTPLRVSFRDPEYAALWRDANPRAVSSRNLLSLQPTMTENTAAAHGSFSRTLPAATLAFCVVLLAAHHWYAVSQHEVYSVILLMLATLGGLALGGTLYPPVFYAAGKYGKHLSVGLKVAAGLSAAIGFALGMGALFTVYSI
jgi:hypothetical protein